MLIEGPPIYLSPGSAGVPEQQLCQHARATTTDRLHLSTRPYMHVYVFGRAHTRE